MRFNLLKKTNKIKNIQEKNHIEITNNLNNKKSKISKRSSSALNIKKNNNVRIVSSFNKNIFQVKLNCTWNESFSVIYFTYADTTNLVNNAYKKELNKNKVKYILDKIALNWITDNINYKK